MSRAYRYKIRVCILQVLQQMDRFSLRGRRAYIAPSAILVYPRSVNSVGWVCSSIYWYLLAAFLYNVLSVAFVSPDGSKSRKRCSNVPRARRIILF